MAELEPRRLTRRRFLGASLGGLAGLAVYGCAPSSAPNQGAAPSPASTAGSPTKTVNLATGTGIFNGIPDIVGVNALNQPEIWGLAHSSLSMLNHDSQPIPMLAQQLPSFDDGTWVVNPDGTMQVTWLLRRDVLWHDGTPFTASDVRFSWEFAQDDSLPLVRRPVHTNVTAIDTPDDYTAVMHWKISNTYAQVLTPTDLFIYPEHIVRPLWEAGEGERLLANDFFHGSFVGLGPFRVDQLGADNSILLRAFDGYFLGRPKIDTVVFNQLESSQGVLTRMLAGDLQMANAYGLNFDDGQTVQQQWQSTGEGTVYWTPISLQRLVLPPDNPLFQDVRVRQALLYALDREEMDRTLFNGLVVIADSLLHPNEPGYQEGEAVVTRYAHDPQQALDLFAAAGWQRGSDGVLVNAAGDRFEVTYRALANNQEQLHVQGAIADYWKDVGISTIFDNTTLTAYNDPEAQANFLGAWLIGGSSTDNALYRRWHSDFIPTAANHYTGDNVARWNNPQADALLERIEATFDQAQKNQLLAQLAALFSVDLPCLPIYFQAEPVAIRKELLNARPRPNSSGQNNTTWDSYQWDLA